jgi:hypothetical protein
VGFWPLPTAKDRASHCFGESHCGEPGSIPTGRVSVFSGKKAHFIFFGAFGAIGTASAFLPFGPTGMPLFLIACASGVGGGLFGPAWLQWFIPVPGHWTGSLSFVEGAL